jgi:hypothetical protein
MKDDDDDDLISDKNESMYQLGLSTGESGAAASCCYCS